MGCRLPLRADAALAAMKAELRARFGDRLRSVTLFGSRAWGTPRADSDVDVCIVIDGLGGAERSLAMDVVAEVAVAHDVELAPVIWETERLERYLAIEYKLAEDIVRRGVVL